MESDVDRTCIDANPDDRCTLRHASAARFGLTGRICGLHYNRRASRLKHAARQAAGAVPCDGCGTTGGYVKPGDVRPVRYRRERDGRQVSLCQSCRCSDGRTGGGGVDAPRTPGEVQARALKIFEEKARRGYEKEVARITRFAPGPRPPTSPAEGAARALKEFAAATGEGGGP